MKQKTLMQSVAFEGVGIHSGLHEKIHCYPSFDDYGIVFQHAESQVELRVGSALPVATDCATVFMQNGWRLSTVEHLLAACAGLGINNLKVVVEGGEIPILDGSSLPFMQVFLAVGLQELIRPVRYIRLLDVISIEREERSIVLMPSDDLGISFSMKMTRPAFLSGQSYEIGWVYKDQRACCQEVLPARTFGDYGQWEMLQEHGLARGAREDNVIAWKGDAWMQDLRWTNEAIRHKVLDCYGDLFLLGGFLCANVRARNSGHALHQELIKFLMDNPKKWEFFSPLSFEENTQNIKKSQI